MNWLRIGTVPLSFDILTRKLDFLTCLMETAHSFLKSHRLWGRAYGLKIQIKIKLLGDTSHA